MNSEEGGYFSGLLNLLLKFISLNLALMMISNIPMSDCLDDVKLEALSEDIFPRIAKMFLNNSTDVFKVYFISYLGHYP